MNPLINLAWKILSRRELKINTRKCVACGKCFKTCQHNAIRKNQENQYEVLKANCPRCYHFKENCSKQAIEEAH